MSFRVLGLCRRSLGNTFWGIVALVLVLFFEGSARAVTWPDETFVVLPCRPTVACTADLVGPGMLEIEAGYLLRKSSFLQHSTPFVVKYSMFSWLQLQIGGNGGQFLPETRYFDDLYAGVKLKIRDADELMPSFAMSVLVNLPTGPGNDPLDPATIDPARPDYLQNYNGMLALYVTKEKSIVHADFNVGLNLMRLNDVPSVQVWGALAISVALPHSFTIMGELYAISDSPPAGGKDAGFLFALAWAPKPYLAFDIGGDAGLMTDVRTFSAFAGVTFIPVSFYNRKKLPPPESKDESNQGT